MTGWGFTNRPRVTLGNAVFRGLIGGTGGKQAIERELEGGAFTVSPHGNGSRTHTEATRITVQEAAVLQSYPADFEFYGKKGKVGLQIGNAVPPAVAEAVFRVLWEAA